MLERFTNLVDLVFLLREKHLILVVQHYCEPFPPSRKCSDFGLFTLLSYWIIFVIFLVYFSTCGPKME